MRYTSTLCGSTTSSPGLVVEWLLLDPHGFRHAAHEQQRRQHHADIDRHHQVDEHREHEGDEQQQPVGARRGAQQAHHVRGVGHVPGHEEQDGGERGQRHVRRQRREQQDHQQQEQRVHHARDRTGRAVADVGGGARDGAGGGEAAEQRR